MFFVEECGLKLNDTMIWCLSGGTYLYVKSSKGVQPMTIKDMVRLDPSTIQLWDGMKWVNVVKWYENKDVKSKIRIQLRSGENIYCTNEHRWVLENGEEVLTKDLKIGDILKTCNLPNEGEHKPIFMTNDMLWVLGLYLAEGSHADDTIQFSLCADEISWVDKIGSVIESVGGSITYTINGNSLNVRCYSKVFNAILSQYIGGKTAKDKHLTNICWKLSNDDLKCIVEGYLDGDGGYDEKNDRWRLGFTENSYLERDLRILASRLNAKITLLRKGSRIKSLNKVYPSLKGEWKWERSEHHNSKKPSEILLITEEKIREDEHMWDIEVDSEEHLFSLASGVITHNCKLNPMPQVKQCRYSDCFEYMFVFSKGKPKTFNPIKVPCKSAGKNYNSTGKNIGGENGRRELNYIVNSEKVKNNIWEYGVASNKKTMEIEIDGEKIEVRHPAVFPIEMVIDHIKSWTNEGDIVLDPFMGSGTVAMASILTNRKYVGIELNEHYHMLCMKNISDLTK